MRKIVVGLATVGTFALLASCAESDPAPKEDEAGESVFTAGIIDNEEGYAIDTLVAAVDSEKLAQDIQAIAGARPAGSEHWEVVREACAARLEALGMRIERHDYGTGTNIIGTLDGADPAAPRVMVSAHYDSVPNCDGADDNASGVAGVWETVRALSGAQYQGTLVAACWAEEEQGAIASFAYAERGAAAGEVITASLVYEMIGYVSEAPGSQLLPDGFELFFPTQSAWVNERGASGDFLALAGDDTAAPITELIESFADSVSLPVMSVELDASQKNDPLFADLQSSDHASFWSYDYPAVMITDTAYLRNDGYHCFAAPDSFDRLDMDFAADVVRSTVGAVARTLGVLLPDQP